MNDKYGVNPDTFRRWMKIGSLIEGEYLNILDVGGAPNNDAIKLFIPHRITAANPQYNNISGTSLPFANESFDITISIDTLEHVPAAEREMFIKELIRTARTKVILACPFDDPLVSGMEKAIYAITKNPFLEEHIKCGLPSLPQTLDIIESMGLTYTIHNNDPLIAWASWILLHQTNMGRFNLSEVNYLLNQAYDVEEDHETSYRKVIEVFKENPGKSTGAFNAVETTSATSSKGQQEAVAATTSGDGFCEERAPHSTDSHKKTCPSTPSIKGFTSIVIPTITISYLAECIQSIEKNTPCPNYEIIIVNDGSSEPEFMDYLASTKHRVINLSNNVGFARANNEGFKVAKGEYIMTLNADTLVHENWLMIMINTLESCKDVAAVGPTVLRAGTQVIETGGCFLDKDNARMVTSFLLDKMIQDYPQINTAYRVDTIVGVCMLFRRCALFEVGLFDGNFVNGWEDVDICLSLRDKGHKIYHAPAIIEHYGSVARNKFSREEYVKMVNKNRNHFNVKLKNHAKRLAGVAERLAEKNRHNEAIKYFMMAIETGVDLAYNYYNLAVAYHRNNQMDTAIRCFEKVVDLEPHNAHAYNNLGVLYFLRGSHKKAEYYFNKALSLDAGYEEAKQNLKKLHLQKIGTQKKDERGETSDR
ncbi:MAG: glycosyltransferase [Planctomycetes bacterium]|nr:glycosyltransferase [Planctomycetota bacterium]